MTIGNLSNLSKRLGRILHVSATFLPVAVGLIGTIAAKVPAPEGRTVAFYGLLLATAGVAMCVVSRKFGLSKSAEELLCWVLGFAAIFGILCVAANYLFPCKPSEPWCSSLPDGGVCCAIASLEAFATLVWLMRTAKRGLNQKLNIDR